MRLLLCYFAFLFCGSLAFAHNKVVVVPLGGAEGERPSNVVTVAKSGGDFSDPVHALESIIDANSQNPYVVLIAPGTYTVSESLVMKPNVNLIGSGKEITTIVGNLAGETPEAGSLVISEFDGLIAEMTLANLDAKAGAYKVGLYVNGINGFELRDMSIRVSSARGDGYGIFNQNSSIRVNSSTIRVSGSASDQYGIYSAAGVVRSRISNSSIFINDSGPGLEGSDHGIYHSSNIDSSQID